MRRLLVVLLGALLGVAVVAVIVARNLNQYLERNKDWLADQAAAALGRPVRFERLTVSLGAGLAVRVDGLRVADDPRFAAGDFLRVDSARVVVAALPAILGRWEVKRLVLVEPAIKLVRTAQGLNAASLGGGAPGEPRPREPPGDGGALLLFSRVTVRDGEMHLVDRTTSPPRTIVLRDVDLTASDLSRTTPMRLQLAAAVRGAAQDLHLDGRVGPLTATPMPLDATLDVAMPALAGSAKVDARLGTARAGDAVPPVDGTIVVRDLRAAAGERAVRIDEATLRLEGRSAVLPSTRVAVDGAAIDVDGTFASLAPLRFDVRTRTTDAPLDRLSGTPALKGRLAADLRIAGAGATADAILASLRGNGSMQVQDGVIEGVNLPERVLRQVGGIPGLAALVGALPPGRYPEILRSDATRFDRAGGTFTIADRRVRSDDLTLAARDYEMRGRGTFGFDRAIDVVATLVASPALTGDVTGRVREARYITGDDGRLTIPFHVTGQWPGLRVVPDAQLLTAALRRALVGEGVERLLGGGKEAGTKGERRPPEETIRQGIEGLLGR